MKEFKDKKPWKKPELTTLQFNETSGGDPYTTGESVGYES